MAILQGSGSSNTSVHNSISGKLCKTSDIKAYTVKDKYYFYIKFNRKKGGSSSKRGFVSGFVIYKPYPYALIWITMASVLIFGIILVIMLIKFMPSCKRKTIAKICNWVKNACDPFAFLSTIIAKLQSRQTPGPTAANSNEASSSIATIHPTDSLAVQLPSGPSLEVSNEPPPAYDEMYPAGP
eukprot:gene17999-19797_t